MKEKCIRCGKETEFDIHTPVDRRKNYVDGSGQLCEDCWKKLYLKDSRGEQKNECRNMHYE